jgi:hypothetical protein
MGLVVAARVVASLALILVPAVLATAGVLVSLQDDDKPAARPTTLAPSTTQRPEAAAPATTAPPPEPTVRGRRVHILDVRPGQCVNLLDPKAQSVGDVRVVPCRQPHDLEVFAVVTLPGSRYPGDGRIQDLADDACTAHLLDYTGRNLDQLDDSIDYGFFTPDRGSWQLGDRQVTCSLESTSGERLTGSLRGRDA